MQSGLKQFPLTSVILYNNNSPAAKATQTWDGMKPKDLDWGYIRNELPKIVILSRIFSLYVADSAIVCVASFVLGIKDSLICRLNYNCFILFVVVFK